MSHEKATILSCLRRIHEKELARYPLSIFNLRVSDWYREPVKSP